MDSKSAAKIMSICSPYADTSNYFFILCGFLGSMDIFLGFMVSFYGKRDGKSPSRKIALTHIKSYARFESRLSKPLSGRWRM